MRQDPTHRRLLQVGLIGTVLAALCCFTPVLVVLFGAVGLSAVVGWIDPVVILALAGFLGLTLLTLWRRRQP